MQFFSKNLLTSDVICYIIAAVKFFWFTDEQVIKLAKDLSVSVLMDFYGELLTPKQQQALDSYYNQDLSLAEIASEMEVSRQGVRNFIKTGEMHLAEFEEKLNLAKKFITINKIADGMAEAVEKLPSGEIKTVLLSDIDSIKGQL